MLYPCFILFWQFSNDHPYFGYNSAQQEIPLLCFFLLLGTYMESNGPGLFRGLIFREHEHYGVLESHERRPEG
jgi:hypothetical protein